MAYNYLKNPKRARKIWLSVIGSIFLIIITLVLLTFLYIKTSLKPANPNGQYRSFEVFNGMTDHEIAVTLQKSGLIRSSLVYELYLRYTHNSAKTVAGQYSLSPSQSTINIADTLSGGKTKNKLVTILPGKTIAEIRAYLIEQGYPTSTVDLALSPNSYPNNVALKSKPAQASLEGYISPESYFVTDSAPLNVTISRSLDKTGELFTDQNIAKLKSEGLSINDAVILASMVEQEVSSPEDRQKVAQVFLSRLSKNMKLGSDVTAIYGAKLYGKEISVDTDTPYNTRLHTGLPPGPLSNFSRDSFEAVVNPAKTDYLYFVSGDDGNTYFSHTLEQHNALAAQYCHKLCSE